MVFYSRMVLVLIMVVLAEYCLGLGLGLWLGEYIWKVVPQSSCVGFHP